MTASANPLDLSGEGPGIELQTSVPASVCAAQTYTISGHVLNQSTGQGVAGVFMNLTDANGNALEVQQTDSSGSYSYTLAAGTYTLTPGFSAPSLYWISPSASLFTLSQLSGNVTKDYTAVPKTTVFLIHGIGQTSDDMQALGTNLLAPNGTALDPTRFFVDATFDFGDCAANSNCAANCGIALGSQRLAQHVLTWQAPVYQPPAGPPGDVVFIGYSMGGLIARDLMGKGLLGSTPRVRGLVTLGVPNLGYPYVNADQSAMCPQLVLDMAGSWNPNTGQPLPYLAENSQVGTPDNPAFLQTLTQNWQSASYGNYWMAAAGEACSNPYRNSAGVATGCLLTSQTSDCVVCRDSALYQGANASGPVPSQGPFTPWRDTAAQYVHTTTASGFGTFVIFGANPTGAIPLYNPLPQGDLFKTITAVINGY